MRDSAFLSATKGLATGGFVAFNASDNLGLEREIKSLRERPSRLPNRIREKLVMHPDQGIAEPLYVGAQKGYGVKQST